jgi:uncharacterized protein YjaG (DUF416 family)
MNEQTAEIQTYNHIFACVWEILVMKQAQIHSEKFLWVCFNTAKILNMTGLQYHINTQLWKG